MRALPVLAVVLGLAACQKAESGKQPPAQASGGDHTVPADEEEEESMKPVILPAAGTAPAPVIVAADFAAAWETPLVTLDGEMATLEDFKGKALLIVNVASQCGLTPQYSALEALQDKYGKDGFTVVGFPCNQFGGQEPGTSEEIHEFCSTKYGISFPLMEKIEVNGAGRHPLYQRLTTIADASGHTGDIRWNFEKFMVSADRTEVTRFSPKTTPDDPALIAALEHSLLH